MRRFWECGIVAVFLFSIDFLQVRKSTEAGKIAINCPEFCLCDIFENLKRAVCKHRRLVSIELNIPSQAEILDLSDNQISELGDKIFLESGLTDLKLLNLSHNKVRQIHFNAFQGLVNLKTLDLSFNAIEYLTKLWFDGLRFLEELYLRGNKLRRINEEAPIDIKTLRILDISDCGIIRLNADTFKMIPNLEILDVSDNFLRIVQVEVLKALPKLTMLKAQENNFNCKDPTLIQVRNYARSKKIRYLDSCMVGVPTSLVINNRVHKFEKMVSQDIEVTTISLKNLWLVDEIAKNMTKEAEICDNGTRNDVNSYDDSLLMDIILLSPWLIVSIIFVYGVLCGIVLTCAINLCIKKKAVNAPDHQNSSDGSVRCNIASIQSVSNPIAKRDRRYSYRSNSFLSSTLQKARRQMSREHLDDDDDDYDETLMMNEFDLSNSTPVAPRKPLS